MRRFVIKPGVRDIQLARKATSVSVLYGEIKLAECEKGTAKLMRNNYACGTCGHKFSVLRYGNRIVFKSDTDHDGGFVVVQWTESPD